jgi:hypothetical protein
VKTEVFANALQELTTFPQSFFLGLAIWFSKTELRLQTAFPSSEGGGASIKTVCRLSTSRVCLRRDSLLPTTAARPRQPHPPTAAASSIFRRGAASTTCRCLLSTPRHHRLDSPIFRVTTRTWRVLQASQIPPGAARGRGFYDQAAWCVNCALRSSISPPFPRGAPRFRRGTFEVASAFNRRSFDCYSSLFDFALSVKSDTHSDPPPSVETRTTSQLQGRAASRVLAKRSQLLCPTSDQDPEAWERSSFKPLRSTRPRLHRSLITMERSSR